MRGSATLRHPWLASYYWLLAFFLYLPIIFLLVFSFNDSPVMVFPLKGFTLRWYLGLLEADELIASVWNSVWLGLGSSLVATLLGTMAGIAITRFEFPGKQAFVGLAALPLVIPYVVLGVGLLILLDSLGIELSLFDEFALSFFLIGNETTLPVTLYSQLRFPSRLPLVVSLAAVIMVVSVLVVVFSEWLRRVGQPAEKLSE